MQTLLVLDDNPDERNEIASQVATKLGAGVNVQQFTGLNIDLQDDESYEQFLLRWFKENSPSFIACDKELGRYEELKGLSATPVSAVAADLGIPFCLYSRQGGDATRDFEKYKRLRKWSTDEITLGGNSPVEWSNRIVSIYKGFKFITDQYDELPLDKTPPAALASILDNPDAEPRIALYGSGEQSFLMETLSFVGESLPDLGMLRKRMPRVLGNWLLLSILRFPGIFVNKIAAMSYLNLDEVSLDEPKIKAEFESARYSGPFSELKEWWWRDKLDAILDVKGVDDGFALAKELGVPASQCLDAEGNRTGYYCMITHEPVSAEKSSSNISWFPSGADLARIRKDKYNQITALVGMY